MFGLACGTCFDAGGWANRQAHAHASTGGHVDQCIKAEFTNLALEPRYVLSGGRIAWVQQGAAPVTGSSSHLISQDRQVLCESFDQIAAKVCRGTLGAVSA